LSRKLWSAFAAFIMLLAALGITIIALPAPAQATPVTIPWPGVPTPGAELDAHGDNSLSVISSDCAYYYNYGDTTPSIVTFNADYSASHAIVKNSSGWKITACEHQRTVGSDGVVYFVQQATPYKQQIVAMRGSNLLWTRSFPTGCGGYQPTILNPTIGFDGELYIEVNWPQDTSCSGKLEIAGLDYANGAIHFETTLPSIKSPYLTKGVSKDEIMPYSTGIAVANGTSVYYYSYSGSLDSDKTFTPSTSGSNPYISDVSTTADGRAYILTKTSLETKLYYKDPGSATIYSMAEPTGKYFAALYVAPSDGVVILWLSSSSYSMSYYDNTGTLIYQKDLSSETGAYLQLSVRPDISVDNQGSVIVVRRMSLNTSPYDQEIYVDSFSLIGVKTRLFDSEAQFGSSSVRDFFTTSAWSASSIGDGEIFLTLCHQTTAPGGTLPTTCISANTTPQIVVIPTSSQFDYPRSAAFAAQAGKANYVALGDSYSSGEGNPSFIAPSDTDGCHRSFAAYPTLVALASNSSLRAFVACSGATTSDVVNGHDGEPSQLDSLDAGTDIVTITVGGDDAEFSDFAEECVIGTCDSASAQYQTTMEIIGDPLLLQASLESLFEQVRSAAPNAVIDVVGYPDVVAPGGNCPTYLSSGEQIAVETVVTGLNNDLRTAVSDSGSGFQFIDPTMTGSPFDGHDLCSADSYFNGLSIPQTQYSFHPNAAGQAAYAELIANNM